MFEFGKIIKEAREKRGLTQTELGTLIGRSQNHIAKIEAGTRMPAFKLLEVLVNTLSIDLPTEVKEILKDKSKFQNGLIQDILQNMKFLTGEDIDLVRDMVRNLAKKNRSVRK